MTRTDEFLANFRQLEQATDKVMLNHKEAAAAIGCSLPTLRKYYGHLFQNGKITKARLAEAMTRR